MPPKQKFTREEIIEAALRLHRKEGLSLITARTLGEELGSSSRPIFTVFENMEEVQKETIKAARAVYNGYIAKALEEKDAFENVGRQYIRFAAEEPKLFQTLFMAENPAVPEVQNVLGIIDENNEEILLSVEKECGLDKENALRLYQEMWIFSHGIATLIATKVCSFSPEKITEMFADLFIGIVQKIKEEQ